MRCVKCTSERIDWMAPSVYDCLECGFRAGHGSYAQEMREQAARIKTLSLSERHARARTLVRDADRLLLACIGSLPAAAPTMASKTWEFVSAVLDGVVGERGSFDFGTDDGGDDVYNQSLDDLHEANGLLRRARLLDPQVPAVPYDEPGAASDVQSADITRTIQWIETLRVELRTYLELEL
ncbi:MAG: hypothetical protein KTR31_14955 [Myxococcales bacterium]|nr:hypothetical protein [Myxococcales bacterium]